MAHSGFDLVAAARQEMIDRGLRSGFLSGGWPATGGARDSGFARRGCRCCATCARCCGLPSITILRGIWIRPKPPSASDAGIRVLVAIADVESDVPIGSPIDQHAAAQTTSVYTGIRTFSMLPEQLSTDLTSLNQDADRLAVVVDMVVAPDGSVTSGEAFIVRWCAIRRS